MMMEMTMVPRTQCAARGSEAFLATTTRGVA
jgi:hypothetical protein